MKTCVDCGCDLPTPLDEFGEIGEERCQTHWLEHQWQASTMAELDDLKKEKECAEARMIELEGEKAEIRR